MTNFDRMIWAATCDTCLTNFAAWPHPEAIEDVPDPEEWEAPSYCPVCDAHLDWEFGDPMRPYIRTGYTPQELQEDD